MPRIFISGDVMNLEHSDGKFFHNDLVKIIQSADYAVCNFEAPISGHGNPEPKSGPNYHQCPETIEGLKKSGFCLLLLANNHIMDYGTTALKATLAYSKENELDTIGAGLNASQAYKPFIKTIKGIKVGMINAGEAQFGVIDLFNRKEKAGYAWINHSQIDKNILKLRNESDFIIVFSHAGLEHYDIPQKEWRDRYRHFCDLGADVVVGAHPHVPQGYERHGNSLIFYSLGNFYMDSPKYRNKEDRSFSILLELMVGKAPNFSPVFHYKHNGRVGLAPLEKQVDLNYLCKQLTDNYETAHDIMNLEAYETTIKENLLFSLLPLPFIGNFRRSLRIIGSRILGRSKKPDKTLLQLHLLRNEAYYYAMKHALEIYVREKSKQ